MKVIATVPREHTELVFFKFSQSNMLAVQHSLIAGGELGKLEYTTGNVYILIQ